jgi:L-aspartate oxidase
VTFARVHKRIRFAEWTRVSGLIVADGRVVGADLASAERTPSTLSADTRGPHWTRIRIAARSVLIASGGAGQVYSDTTNPAIATGDGIALAANTGVPADRSSSVGWSSGAELADMEFYQFHPTALALEGAPRFLISEALRGEGAWLVNHRGERFMERYHPLLELAPRDVVARAIAREGIADLADPQSSPRPIYLDMRQVRNIDPASRFPGISAFLARYGLDLRRDLIPVRPAAHYLMGGIRTDLGGRTSIAGLYAAGEAACTGVHGANRLASNSLLEGLVFGARAAQSMLSDSLPLVHHDTADTGPVLKHLHINQTKQLEDLISALQAGMWANAGLLRDESSLHRGLAAQAACEAGLAEIAASGRTSRRLSEAHAICCVARAILVSALARTESRGAHFRNDFPSRDDASFCRHSIIRQNGSVQFDEW